MAHITDEVLQAYVDRMLPMQMELEIMEHIAKCDNCANRFARLQMGEPLVSPPPGLREDILQKTVYRRKAVWTVRDIQERRREKQRELLVYCVRIVFATAVSVLMLFTMPSGMGRRQRSMPSETMQAQSQKAESRAVKRNAVSASLQKASGKVGDALNDFLAIFDDSDKEERE